MNKQEVYQFLKENGNEINIVKIWLYTLWESAICIILFLKNL